VTKGKSEIEALEMAKEAIELALEFRRDKQKEIPSDLVPEVHKVSIAVSA